MLNKIMYVAPFKDHYDYCVENTLKWHNSEKKDAMWQFQLQQFQSNVDQAKVVLVEMAKCRMNIGYTS